MKTSLSHLPQHKQDELDAIKRIICENEKHIEIILLFGSYARGNWVEDEYIEEGVTYGYKSDYDLLLIFDKVEIPNQIAIKSKLEKLIRNSGEVDTLTRMIVHDIHYLNHKLTIGSYFFVDVVKEGIILYNSGNFTLAESKELSQEERKKYAQEDFEDGMERANEFFIDFRNALERESYNNAALYLHQVTERYYHTISLVFTRYKPKLHDIEELERQVCSLDTRFCKVFPRNTHEEIHRFDLLKKSYIEARYSKKFKITKEELEYLAEKVQKLKKLTYEICKEKIENF